MAVVIGMYALDHVADARSDKRRPTVSLRGQGSMRWAKKYAATLQEDPIWASGQCHL